MSKDSRILLFAIAVATLFLAIFNYVLYGNALKVNSLVTGQNVNKVLQSTASNSKTASASASVAPTEEPEETPAQKTASASATLRPRVATTPTATPESQ